MPTDNRALKARSDAIRKLIDNHKEEFETLYGDAREAAGLSRDKNDLSPAVRQRRIDKHLAALRKLGVEV